MGLARNTLETAQTGYTWLLIISFSSYVSVGVRWPETQGFFFSFLSFLHLLTFVPWKKTISYRLEAGYAE